MVNELLLWLFLIPLIGSAILFFLPFLSFRASKGIAFILSLIPLGLFLSKSILGAELVYDWLPNLGVQFFLKVDGVSLLFLYLTAIIVPFSILAADKNSIPFSNAFFALILLVEGLLIGFFMARDLVLFTIFFEAMLIPLYFIIAFWGGVDRRFAALKFLLYMIAGSALLIAAVLALFAESHSFNLDELAKTAMNTPHAPILLGVFLLAFAVKTPLFPFHGWLPDAYTEAPLPGTILLSALLSKAGIYGIFRIGVELFPNILAAASDWLAGVAIAGVFYAGFAAWGQTDFKRLIAYSSLSHVNFILAGLFTFTSLAQAGGILQAFNHGITIAALFWTAGWLEKKLGSTLISAGSGMAKFLPHLAWLTLFFVLASVALPGTNNFVGEIMILVGIFEHNIWAASILALSVILSVMYMLRWMQKVYFEAPSFFKDSWTDILPIEWLQTLPLILIILWVGIYPAPFLNLIKPQLIKESSK